MKETRDSTVPSFFLIIFIEFPSLLIKIQWLKIDHVLKNT